MLLFMIDTMKSHEVATADIPGAFLQTEYDHGYINMKLEGEMVTLLEEINPYYYTDFSGIDKRVREFIYAEAKKGDLQHPR